jgi:DNA polymerase-3 subunit delta'
MTWRIIGHERVTQTLARAARDDTPAHAYLIVGPPQVGKRTLARELAAALNCLAAPELRPCHDCAACRTILAERHPDLIVVERDESRQTLRVEQVREARATVALRPYQARYKVYILVDADEMNDEAANALLKTLEDPPPHVVIALTASQVEALPQTVVSRSRIVPLQPVPAAEIAQGLDRWHDVPAEQARHLAALANGSPGWAIAALSAPAIAEQRERAVSQAVELSYGSLSKRLLLAGEVCSAKTFAENRALCLRALQDMQVWWRDLLVEASGARAPLVHQDRRDEVARQATARGAERIVRALREIEATTAAVERNVTPRLALESLILRLN